MQPFFESIKATIATIINANEQIKHADLKRLFPDPSVFLLNVAYYRCFLLSALFDPFLQVSCSIDLYILNPQPERNES